MLATSVKEVPMKRAVTLVAGLALACAAFADEYPWKPLHIVVPNPPGGTVDIVARAVAQGLGSSLGQPVVVEPKPGGNNVIGSEAVARAAPDGYTILLGGTHVTINPLTRKLPYDGMHAFAPVALLAATPNVIAVHPSLPVHSVAELIALAKAKPGELNLATASPGNGIHLAAERFQSLSGARFNFIPYQGGVQAVLAVAGGHAEVLIAPLSDAAPHVASGRVRLLAVTSAQRSELVKDVPTLAESGFPGFAAVQWFGAFVPASTPKPVIDRLSAEMRRAVDSPQVRTAFATVGLSVTPMGPAEFGQFLRAETAMFAATIRETHYEVE
jgi:tripartite-type tricarboxylate transporter receptor subunit TctC